METNATKEVVKYLQKGKSITPAQAFDRFGTTSLKRVIYDLRRQGMKRIKTTLVKSKTRFGMTCTFAKYSLK